MDEDNTVFLGMDLKKFGYRVGILAPIACIIYLIVCCVSLTQIHNMNIDDLANSTGVNKTDLESFFEYAATSIWIQIGMLLLGILFSILVIVGIKQENYKFFIPWIILGYIGAIWSAFAFFQGAVQIVGNNIVKFGVINTIVSLVLTVILLIVLSGMGKLVNLFKERGKHTNYGQFRNEI